MKLPETIGTDICYILQQNATIPVANRLIIKHHAVTKK